MVSPTSASASAQFLPTSYVSHAQNSNFRSPDDLRRAQQQGSRAPRPSSGSTSQKQSSAACMACSACSAPAFWCTPTTCAGRAGFSDRILSAVLQPMLRRSPGRIRGPSWLRHQLQRRSHRARVFRGLEIGKRLIAELALRRTRLNFGRKRNGSHSDSIVVEQNSRSTGLESKCALKEAFSLLSPTLAVSAQRILLFFNGVSFIVAKTKRLSSSFELVRAQSFLSIPRLRRSLRRQPGFQQFRYIRETNPPTQGSKLGTPGSV